MDIREAVSILPMFLSIFDLYINENDDNLGFLLDGYGITIYDSNYNIVGRAMLDGWDINIQVMLKYRILSIIGTQEGMDGYRYTYEIKNLNEQNFRRMCGHYSIRKGKKYDDYTIDVSGNIYRHNKRRCAFKFSTLKNKFLLVDYKDCDSVFYRKNELYHNTDDYTMVIKSDNGDLEYQVIAIKDDENLAGYMTLPLVPDVARDEIAFRKIIDDVDPGYFDLVKKVEEKTDYFVPGIFKKAACRGLKNFNKSQLSAILDLDFSNDYCKQKVFTGKKSSE